DHRAVVLEPVRDLLGVTKTGRRHDVDPGRGPTNGRVDRHRADAQGSGHRTWLHPGRTRGGRLARDHGADAVQSSAVRLRLGLLLLRPEIDPGRRGERPRGAVFQIVVLVVLVIE